MASKYFICSLLIISCALSRYVAAADINYEDALQKALLFFEAQRSGKLPADNMVKFRGDSGLDDGKDVGKDLTGGWHDAGDTVKFGLPMASSATMLLYGLEFFKDGYGDTEKLGKRQVKWALDYFIKCHVDKTKLYIQVGDPDKDHAWWGRPEDWKGPRPAQWMGAGKPKGGADIAGETAAALAAGSIVFNDKNMLEEAKSIYELAKKNEGLSKNVISNINKFYASDSYKDELAHAAAWLSYAVNVGSGNVSDKDSNYLEEADHWLTDMKGTPWAMSWNEKRPAVNLLMYNITGDDKYKGAVEDFLKDWRKGGKVPRTKQGLVFRDKWGSNRYAANAACVALLAAKMGINAKENYEFAKEQMEILLGANGESFMVGFGKKYPTHAHHRAASCPNKPAPCGWNNFNSPNPNPQLLKGALVGGPGDLNGGFVDDRKKYEYTEVATDYNAGFTTALAGMVELKENMS